MFKRSNDDALRREQEQKEFVNSALVPRDRESQILARDQLAVTSQVAHLTPTVKELREHLSAQTDFAVDAMQQVCDEFTASIAAFQHSVQRGDAALNAGGRTRPEDTTNT